MKNLYARFLLWLLLPVFQLRAAQWEKSEQLRVEARIKQLKKEGIFF